MENDLELRSSDFEEDRYSRLRLIPWWDQERLKNATIMVVGAGAIGNELIKNLALLGIGKILVFDMDAIENTNLTRSVLYRRKDVGRYKAEVAAERAMEMNRTSRQKLLSATSLTMSAWAFFAEWMSFSEALITAKRGFQSISPATR